MDTVYLHQLKEVLKNTQRKDFLNDLEPRIVEGEIFPNQQGGSSLGKGSNIKISKLLIGKEGENSNMANNLYLRMKNALEAVFNINQVFGNGIAQNSGFSIAMNSINKWLDEKSESCPEPNMNLQNSYEKLLEIKEELMNKVEKIFSKNPEIDKALFQHTIDDALYYQSSKDDHFVSKEYVIRAFVVSLLIN